jgi:hypothetical protein
MKLRHYAAADNVLFCRDITPAASAVLAVGRGLHSCTSQLNVSTFYGICRVHDSPSLLDRGTRGGVTKPAQVELRIERV